MCVGVVRLGDDGGNWGRREAHACGGAALRSRRLVLYGNFPLWRGTGANPLRLRACVHHVSFFLADCFLFVMNIRFAVAGTFALIGGAAALLMVVSILQSCRQGGEPHDMGTDARPGETPTTAVAEPPAQHAGAHAPNAAALTIPRE